MQRLRVNKDAIGDFDDGGCPRIVNGDLPCIRNLQLLITNLASIAAHDIPTLEECDDLIRVS